MTIFLALLITAMFFLTYILRYKFLGPESIDADSHTYGSIIYDSSIDVEPKVKNHRDPNGTLITGRYTVSVYRPDEDSIYKEDYIPDNCDCYKIGAGNGDNLVIPDKRVSHAHVLIGSDEKGLFVRDNNSTNGTRLSLNGTPIKDQDIEVVDNLELYLGPVKIKFHDTTAAKQPFSLIRRQKKDTDSTKTKIYSA